MVELLDIPGAAAPHRLCAPARLLRPLLSISVAEVVRMGGGGRHPRRKRGQDDVVAEALSLVQIESGRATVQ